MAAGAIPPPTGAAVYPHRGARTFRLEVGCVELRRSVTAWMNADALHTCHPFASAFIDGALLEYAGRTDA